MQSTVTPSSKNKAVIPEAAPASGMNFGGTAENVDESPTTEEVESHSLNKFRTKRNYFKGEGHSLTKASNTPTQPSKSSGFRRESGVARTASVPSESRFAKQEKEDHFKGTGHKLC